MAQSCCPRVSASISGNFFSAGPPRTRCRGGNGDITQRLSMGQTAGHRTRGVCEADCRREGLCKAESSCSSQKSGRGPSLKTWSSFLPAWNRTGVPSSIRQTWVRPARARRLDVRAGTSDTYWVTVYQAVGVAVLTASSGVLAGLLLRYKLRQEAKQDVERVREEFLKENKPLPSSFEEIQAELQGASKERVRNRPVRKGEGLQVEQLSKQELAPEEVKKDEVSML